MILYTQSNTINIRSIFSRAGLKFLTKCYEYLTAEAVTQSCSLKKVFLKVLQNSQKTPVPESLF